MKIILETHRLLLRKFGIKDAEKIFELNTDYEVIKHTGNSSFKNIDEARQLIKNYPDYKMNGYGRWAVIKKETGEFIGWCGLKLNEENVTDIGFRFFRHEWNKGYATESAAACIDYGFNHLNLQEIVGRASAQNLASIRVLEKIGMHFWKSEPCDGIKDAAIYRLSKKV